MRRANPQIPSLSGGLTGDDQSSFLNYTAKELGEAAKELLSIKTVQPATYTLLLEDAGKYLRFTNGSAITLTVPNVNTTRFRQGTVIHIRQAGSAQITLSPATGVTVNTPETLKTRKQNSSVMLVAISDNVFDLIGDLEPL